MEPTPSGSNATSALPHSRADQGITPSGRARFRGAVLATVVFVHCWLAFPLPQRVTAATLASADAKEELARWRGLLGRLGVEISARELGSIVMDVTGAASDFRQASVRPFQWPLRSTQTGQGWALFASPDTHPNRLELHARIDGDWRLVYRRLEPDYALLAPQLGFRRLRGVYDTEGSKAYKNLAHWAAAQVFEDMPEADAVRMRLMESHTTQPGLPVDPAVRARREVIVERKP